MKKLATIFVACALLLTVCSVLAFAEGGELKNVALGAKYETTPLWAESNGAFDPNATPAYPDTDGKELTDGKIAMTNDEGTDDAGNALSASFYKDSRFMGYSSAGGALPGYNDNGGHVIIVDLGKEYDLSKLSLYVATQKCSSNSCQLPTDLKYYVSSDKENYTQFGETWARDPENLHADVYVAPCTVEVETPVTARYVKIVFTRSSWVFVTEFEAYATVADDTNSDDNNNSGESTTSTETTTSAPASSETSKPATGDAGIIVFAVLGAIAVAGAAVAVKVRH